MNTKIENTRVLTLLPILWLLITGGNSGEAFAQANWRVTGNSGTNPTTNFLGTTDTEDLVIRTDNTERVRVNGRGRVGIGTGDPRQLLDVEIVDHVTDSVSYPARLSHVTSGPPEQGFGTGLEFQIGGAGGIDATLGTIESVLTNATVGAEESSLHFKTTDIGDDGLVSRMSINKDGNVTMGGTGSSAKLNVTGGDGQTILILRRQSAGFVLPSAVIVNSEGQVGINNSAPSANLHVGGPASDGTRTTIAKIGSPLASMFLDGDDIDSWRDILAVNLIPIPLHLNRFSSGNVLLTNGGGNVGIGTSTPDAGRLSVHGPENNGEIASVEIRSGNQQLLLDGNEIDSLNSALFLNHNANQNIHLGTGGGSVGIGTTNVSSDSRLAVNGKIRAKEIIVESGWSDFVFEPDYDLRSLEEVEAHIKEYRHLPDIPSAEQVAEHGVNVGEMEAKLLQKIEELTLHVISMNKRVQALEEENAQLRDHSFQLAAISQEGAVR